MTDKSVPVAQAAPMALHRIATRLLLIVAAVTVLAPASPAGARSAADPVLSPLGMVVADPPHPVLGADGKNHLAYEITIVNQTPSEVRIDRVRPRAGGKPFGAPLAGPALEDLLRVNGGGGPAIPGGGSALLFLDVTYAKDTPHPRRLTHGIKVTLGDPSGAGQASAFVGVPTSVGRDRAIEIAPPLRGSGWVAGEGCCNPIRSHRGATLSIDGTVHVPERFAIDFVRLGQSGRLFEGPIDQLSSFGFYGDRIHSVAAGRVVRVQDGLRDQKPGALPDRQTVQTAGGNYVVVRLDRNHYAFYAHLQAGSLRVRKGQRVRTGQVLGLLGNTGNTDAPHLHFHIMDGPSPLQSNGLPFVYSRFTGQGRVSDEEALVSGAVTPIGRGVLAGAFRDRMPMGLQVVDFGG